MKSLRIAVWVLAASSAGFGQAVPAVPDAAPPKGSIEGQVFNLGTGAPLKKANVRLTGLGVLSMSSKETDEQGRFAFTGLEAGRYQLSAERQGFLRQSYGARKYATDGRPIGLAPDQHVEDIVFKLSPQSVIVGKVLDEDGDPVANVQVRALRLAYRGGKKQWSQVAIGQTSDIGEYRIPGLDPGSYQVATNPRNQASNMMQTPSNDPLPDASEMIYAATYYPSTLDSATAVPVDVPQGQEIRGTDIRLRKTQVFRVRGNLSNVTDGRASVMVMLTPKEGGQPAISQSPAIAPDYRFELRGITPGSYVLYAQPGNGIQPSVAYQDVLVSNHVDGVVLTFAPGNDVQGTVKVEDATAPVNVSNLSVGLRTNTAMPAMPLLGAPRVKVGSDLKFTLRSVAPLHYTVSVAGAPDNCFVKSIKFGGQDVPEDGIDIASGGEMKITLSATAGEVDAAVVDKDSVLVAGAIVALIPADGRAMAGSSIAIQGRVGDEYGAVTFKGLKPGEYSLIAWEDIPLGAFLDPEFRKPFEGRGESVKVDAGAKQAIQVTVIPAEETDK
ncbi:conserved exported hypothetical protein [Candidatus Sulfopaludibacter sp. SbA6]|nr:conserved exported hypothetical protein [Candidatus Sulfopaludibacter sp. SbA6]